MSLIAKIIHPGYIPTPQRFYILHTAHLKMDGTAKLSGMLPLLYHCLPIIDIHQLLGSVHVCMCVWW